MGAGLAGGLAVSAAEPAPDQGEFSFSEESGLLTVFELDRPVLVYNYGPVRAPEGVPQHRSRSCYIHPLYGADGAVLTQDFPPDHYHHRGVFWAWPLTALGERVMDLWALHGIRPVFHAWIKRAITARTTHIEVLNHWEFDDEETIPVVEQIAFHVHAARSGSRAIDFDLTFRNQAGQPLQFLGAAGKGYGGFSFRPDAAHKPFTFVAATGVVAQDALECETPWADISWKDANDSKTRGVAIFQHPSNPDYPHRGWIFRHYGFLGACWPHTTPFYLPPGDSLRLRYRLVTHGGSVEEARVPEMFKRYSANPPA